MQGKETVNRIRENIAEVMVGKAEAIDWMLIALLCRGHVLIEDVPGVGKTTLVSCLAKSLGCSFRRIQFTPDVMPSDVTGFTMANLKTGEFELHTGAIMAQLVLADEINRTSPKTQSALLEAMQEGQVTVDGESHALPQPFMVLATQNPVDYSGTYPLPEAQMDRFLLKIKLGYPNDASEEVDILNRQELGRKPVSLQAICSAEDVLEMQRQVDAVICSEPIKQYIARLVAATRDNVNLSLGVSPRGSIALMLAAKGKAFLDGRDYVTPDDVQQAVMPVLTHRIIVKPEAKLKEMTPRRVLFNIVKGTWVPDAV